MDFYNALVHALALVGLYHVAPPLWRLYRAYRAGHYERFSAPPSSRRRKLSRPRQPEAQPASEEQASAPEASPKPLPAQPAPAPEPIDESELKGNALLDELATRRSSGDRDGMARLMRSAIADGRLELDADMKPKLPSVAKRAKGK